MAFTVSANLCDGNDYVAHWDGGTFHEYDEAYERWLMWEPPRDEVLEALQESMAEGVPEEEHDLQIGLWDEYGNALQFVEGDW